MEKAEVLKLFLEKGYQMDIETLNYFAKNESAMKKFLREMETAKLPSTITKEFVDSMLQSDVEIFELKPERKPLTAEDLSRVLLERFEIIKKILATHMELVNLVSISKITQKMQNFSLIGIVNNIDFATKTVSVADDTGEIALKLGEKNFADIMINDVLGFICEKDGNIRAKNIVFPDVPLRRGVKNLADERFLVFAEDISKNLAGWCESQKKSVYLFTFTHQNDITEFPEDVKTVFVGEGPMFAEIAKIFSVFLFDGSFLQPVRRDKKLDEFLVLLFKKRYFNATEKLDKFIMNNAFVMEKVPDIIVTRGLNEAVQTNYKGTSLLTVDKNTSWIINLKTREIIKLSSS